MEEHFPYFVIDVLSQKHQTYDLQGSKPLKLCPLNVKVKQVGSLLLFFSICSDLLDSTIDQVLGMPVDSAKIFASHHLIVARDASITLLLIFQELLSEKLEEVRVRGCALT